MAFLKIALLLAFACLVQSAPFSSVKDLQQVVKVSVDISAADGNKTPLVQASITVTVWGDFNKTSDSNLLSQFVQEKLSALEYSPEESTLEVNNGDDLPLLFSVELKAEVDISVPVQKTIVLQLGVEVYAKKKDHHHAVDMVKSFKPSF